MGKLIRFDNNLPAGLSQNRSKGESMEESGARG